MALTVSAQQHDPADWGGDHVGKPVPIYEDGNACLFCHRTTIGPSWQTNRHATTIRGIDDEVRARQLADSPRDADYAIGREAILRFLKRAKSYGTVELLNPRWDVRKQVWHDPKGNAHATSFAERCAGCHTSGVDSIAKTFQMVSLDCHTCHGIAVPEHTEDGSLMLLAKKERTLPRVEISICGACHLRGGTSKSTGLPFPNNFVPGDNLFKDFAVDLSEKRIQSENPGEAHILQNTRDVTLAGKTEVTCTTCHDIHAQSTAKHVKLPEQPLCFTCHTQGEPMKTIRPYNRHSATCEY
ncbi:MAG TPA: multiheme c-type cytochrome [Candidatus Hydrogenedentes bacterium]|nr:multiheme c-type cytochrome [Candidatus Hydrogenedentota bacterium]